jgi:hypothetical protein
VQSDARVQAALGALRRPIDAYRSMIVGAAARARELLAGDGGAPRARLTLGEFGGARMDAARFAELAHGAALDALSRARIERAAAVLEELAAAGDEAFVADVARGDSLRVVAARALARLGRAFGAASVVTLVRSGRYEPERHDRLLESLPPEWWSRSERRAAPPLILTVDGADLHAGSLAELLDGAARIVLVVRGACAPAPLVRLVTPGTLVMQAADPAAIARVAEHDGPAVAALVDDAALFTHDPALGAALWQRLVVARGPTAEPTRSLGGTSPRQQREEMAQLEAMAARPMAAAGVTPGEASAQLLAPGGGDPAERLTAWLLAESGLAPAS